MNPRLRFLGTIAELADADRQALLGRSAHGPTPGAVRDAVVAILARVRNDGDAALRRMALTFDHVQLDTLEVPRARWRAALGSLDSDLRAAMIRTARNVAAFHRAQLPSPLEVETEQGVRVGRRPDPLDRVGVYAPGGKASYPSSVLMTVIPARAAGVREIVLCSPPQRDGLPALESLAAAEIAGVDRVFAIGGAGAIAAMAFGTESVPRVDRIVGPGNAYVAEAKLQVSPFVGIDAPAGPSEVLVLADVAADPERVALELCAQAEHDPLACAVAIGIGDARASGEDVAARIVAALSRLANQATAGHAERRLVIRAALEGQGGVLAARDLDEALAFATDYAPEHLLLALEDPASALGRVRNAGTVLLGLDSSVVFGDYMTGANHVLPTGGFARAFSGLSTLDFVRWTTWQQVRDGAAQRLAGDVAAFAAAERLPAHAAAARAAGATRTEPERASEAVAAGVAAVTTRDDAAIEASVAPVTPEPRPRVRPPRPRASFDVVTLDAPEPASGLVDLGGNTNLWGVPPAARRALRGGRRAASRYPSPLADELRRALADYHGVTPDAVVTGAGSDDVLDATLRAFTVPGERLAFMDPTFSMVPVFARLNGLEPLAVPLGPDYDADADGLLATRARVLYLCSPNNPTGTAVSPGAIERVTTGALGIVIVDRAYAEFAEVGGFEERRAGSDEAHPPRPPAVLPAPNTVVLGTLSKAFGLAGLRVGYAVGDPALIGAIAKSRGPYKVGTLAERAAVAALTHDLPWVRDRAARVRRNREWFARALENVFGLAPLPSQANFVLVPVPEARELGAALQANGVRVRAFRSLTGIGDAVRITIGRGRDLMAVLGALRVVALATPHLLPGARDRVLAAWPQAAPAFDEVPA